MIPRELQARAAREAYERANRGDEDVPLPVNSRAQRRARNRQIERMERKSVRKAGRR